MEIVTKTQREQFYYRRNITRKRVETLVPALMKEFNVDAWIILGGDFNHEPVLDYLVDTPPLALTAVLFFRKGDGVERYFSGRSAPGPGQLYRGYLQPGEDTFDGIRRLIEEKRPGNIALDCSAHYRILDGLSHSLYERLVHAAGSAWQARIISAEPLAMRFLETRLPEEIETYRHVCSVARDIVAETFDRAHIEVGETTTADVEWMLRERIARLGMAYTWGPNVDLQRKGSDEMMVGGEDVPIEQGDLLHVDFGVRYLGMESDMQYLAYVLKDGEAAAPSGLVDGFSACRRFQQIYMDLVRPGMTGNEARGAVLGRAGEEGLDAMLYSHPTGLHTHGVGSYIGKFGIDGDLIPNGEYPLRPHTCYAMEQNVRVEVPEWENQKVYIFREEDVLLLPDRVEPIVPLQEELWTI